MIFLVILFFCYPENLDEELQQLYTTFREHASKLVDMLDISLPYVAKLKVNP